ncbi:MAG: TonB family protein [Flavobacteriaceae bacterium]
MKKILLVFFLIGSSCFAQSIWRVSVGDTLFYSKDWVITQKEDALRYIVLKNKEWNKRIRKHICSVNFFRQDTLSKTFYKSEEFNSYRFGSFSREGASVTYWQNGNKSAEGEMKKNRRIDFWTEWYEDGTKKFERRYFQEGDVLKEDYIVSELINFWDPQGEQTVINGSGTFFNKNKDGLETKGSFKNYKRDGVWTGSTEDGSLIYKENYLDGLLEKGESWDEDGKKYTYNIVYENTKYEGGQKAIANLIKENFKVPNYAIENGIEGVILVVFEINKTGKIQNIEVKNKLCDPCAEAALKVVKKFKKWTPAKRRGRPITVKFSLPLRINLVAK